LVSIIAGRRAWRGAGSLTQRDLDDITGLKLKILIGGQFAGAAPIASDHRYRELAAQVAHQLRPGKRGVLKLLAGALQLEADFAELNSCILQLAEQITALLAVEPGDLADEVMVCSFRVSDSSIARRASLTRRAAALPRLKRSCTRAKSSASA
jgi:hypothetical protein